MGEVGVGEGGGGGGEVNICHILHLQALPALLMNDYNNCKEVQKLLRKAEGPGGKSKGGDSEIGVCGEGGVGEMDGWREGGPALISMIMIIIIIIIIAPQPAICWRPSLSPNISSSLCSMIVMPAPTVTSMTVMSGAASPRRRR